MTSKTPMNKIIPLEGASSALTAELLQCQLKVRYTNAQMDERGHIGWAIISLEEEEIFGQRVPVRAQRKGIVTVEEAKYHRIRVCSEQTQDESMNE